MAAQPGRTTLFYVAPKTGNRLSLGYSPESLTSLYPLSDEDIGLTVGQSKNWSETDEEGVRRFLGQVTDLMARVPDGADSPV